MSLKSSPGFTEKRKILAGSGDGQDPDLTLRTVQGDRGRIRFSRIHVLRNQGQDEWQVPGWGQNEQEETESQEASGKSVAV